MIFFNMIWQYRNSMKLFLIVPFLASFTTAFAETGEIYETHTPMPIPTFEIEVVELDDKIYVVGGFTPDGKGSLDTLQVYDTKTDTWTMGSPLPKPLHHLAGATFDGKIYVVGGFEYDLWPLATWLGKNYLFIYDPTSDTWVRGADMPTERGALTADFIDGKLYAVGGKNVLSHGIGGMIFQEIPYPINEVYDPVTNSWEQKAPMPTPRDHIASAVVNEKMYAIGGREGHRSNSLSANEVYDPKTNTWSVLEPLPTIRSGSTASVLNNTIFIFGGETDKRVFNTNEQYIPNEGWITHANMTVERTGLGSATVGDKIYLLGGKSTLLGVENSALNISYYNPQVIPEFNDAVMLVVLVSSFLFVIIFRQTFENFNWNHKSLLNENSL